MSPEAVDLTINAVMHSRSYHLQMVCVTMFLSVICIIEAIPMLLIEHWLEYCTVKFIDSLIMTELLESLFASTSFWRQWEDLFVCANGTFVPLSETTQGTDMLFTVRALDNCITTFTVKESGGSWRGFDVRRWVRTNHLKSPISCYRCHRRMPACT